MGRRGGASGDAFPVGVTTPMATVRWSLAGHETRLARRGLSLLTRSRDQGPSSRRAKRYGVPRLGGLLRNFLNGLLPCAPPPGRGRLAVAGVPREAACAAVSGRLPEANPISSSLSSSHWASVRSFSGIERRASRRRRGGMPSVPSLMAALSHPAQPRVKCRRCRPGRRWARTGSR